MTITHIHRNLMRIPGVMTADNSGAAHAFGSGL